MRRKIIRIDTEKCNGCGACIPDCPEGALQMIDGKARLISDLFCDGLGACIGACPEGAISIEEREAEPYDERRVMENIVEQGENTIRAHIEHLREHGEMKYLAEAVDYLREKGIDIPEISTGTAAKECGGCPGAMAMSFGGKAEKKEEERSGGPEIGSELKQWPVQLKLLNPAASYFDDADLLIAADCSPFAFADFHRKFVRGRTVIMFCPKLDPYIEEYIDKLAAIFATHNIRSVTVIHMEVPCCGGVGVIVKKAMEKAKKELDVKDIMVSIRGEVM